MRRLSDPPSGLAEKLKRTLLLYPCDLLFVHRDAEGVELEERCQEIRDAVSNVWRSISVDPLPAVAVVPVRMLEAWFLLDEAAIRRAAGNPLGRQPLDLPRPDHVEQLPDPKQVLFGLLRDASGLSGRRRRKMRVRECVHRIAELVDDFARLRQLPAFVAVEEQVAQVVTDRGWR